MTSQQRADKLESEYRAMRENDPQRNEVLGRLKAARLSSAIRVGVKEAKAMRLRGAA